MTRALLSSVNTLTCFPSFLLVNTRSLVSCRMVGVPVEGGMGGGPWATALEVEYMRFCEEDDVEVVTDFENGVGLSV